ncbi:hypothetical protein ACXR2W_11560 [Leucobacter sp. HY1908]
MFAIGCGVFVLGAGSSDYGEKPVKHNLVGSFPEGLSVSWAVLETSHHRSWFDWTTETHLAVLFERDHKDIPAIPSASVTISSSDGMQLTCRSRPEVSFHTLAYKKDYRFQCSEVGIDDLSRWVEVTITLGVDA